MIAILFQIGAYSVRVAPRKGYQVFKDGGTAAVLCATYGSDGDRWYRRAVEDAKRRHAEDTARAEVRP